jgi:hypothetical protein
VTAKGKAGDEFYETKKIKGCGEESDWESNAFRLMWLRYDLRL